MNIQPSRITFEQAKLLKEKGCNINTYSNCWVKTLDGRIIHNSERENCAEHDRYEQYLMQPEQWQVIEWLRIKHGIWVYCEIHTDKYYCKAKRIKSNWRRVVSGVADNKNILFNSPQEAYLAAFDCVLTNLI